MDPRPSLVWLPALSSARTHTRVLRQKFGSAHGNNYFRQADKHGRKRESARCAHLASQPCTGQSHAASKGACTALLHTFRDQAKLTSRPAQSQNVMLKLLSADEFLSALNGQSTGRSQTGFTNSCVIYAEQSGGSLCDFWWLQKCPTSRSGHRLIQTEDGPPCGGSRRAHSPLLYGLSAASSGCICRRWGAWRGAACSRRHTPLS